MKNISDNIENNADDNISENIDKNKQVTTKKMIEYFNENNIL